MICPNKCGEGYVVLITEMKNHLWECTRCGWYERIPRKSYEDTVKQNKGEGNEEANKAGQVIKVKNIPVG